MGFASSFLFFFFKQKTAYEMLISDWSSDVCSSDLATGLWGSPTTAEGLLQPVNGFYRLTRGTYAQFGLPVPNAERAIDSVLLNYRKIGRESCRERVC